MTCKLKRIFAKYNDLTSKIPLSQCVEDSASSLNINLKQFRNYISSEKDFYLYGAIYNKKSKEYMKANNKFKYIIRDNLKDYLKIKHNAYILKYIIHYYQSFDKDDYEVHLLLVPHTREYSIISGEIDRCFDHNVLEDDQIISSSKRFLKFFDELNIKFAVLMAKYIIPLFLLLLLPIYTFAYLVYNGGLVESIINISVISNMIVHVFSYFLTEYWKSILWIFGVYFIIVLVVTYFSKYFVYSLVENSLILIFKILLNLIYSIMSYYGRQKRKLMNTVLQQDNIQTAVRQLREYNWLSFIKSIAVLYVNIVFIWLLLLLIPQMSNSTKTGDLSYSNLVRILAVQYLKYSSFPNIAKIKEYREEKEKEVVFLGYDSTYSYVYTIEQIKKILERYNQKTETLKSQGEKDPIYSERVKKVQKYCSEESKQFIDLYSIFIMGSSGTKNNIPLKNSDYTFINVDIDNENFNTIMKDFNNIVCTQINDNAILENVSKEQ